MSRSRAGADGLKATSLSGVSAGAFGLVLAWVGGLAIARLTGATPVVIVLALGVVWFGAALLAGWFALRRVEVGQVSVPPHADAGEPFPVRVTVRSKAPVWVELRIGDERVAAGWAWGDEFNGPATIERRGRVEALDVRVRSAGVTGIIWWRRDVRIAVDELVVAPRPQSASPTWQRREQQAAGESAGRSGAIAGEIDGVRPWREGDGDKSVHWSSTLRAGELVVFDRRHDADRRVLVRASRHTGQPDVEAGRARAAIERGLREGASVDVAVDDDEPVVITDVADGVRWSALVDLGPGAEQPAARRWSRRLPSEPETTARPAARWWSAAATTVSLVMLNGALGYGPLVTAAVVVAVLLAAIVSVRSLTTGRPIPPLVRAVVGVGALTSFVVVAAGIGPLTGLLSMLRGPLPQVLVILVLLHGFECRDRRTIRVGLGISAVVLVYAAGFRVDGSIGWWLLAWTVCFGMASSRLALPTSVEPPTAAAPASSPSRFAVTAPRFAAVALGAVATIALLAVVPVPAGPARLTLPTFISDSRDVAERGAIAGPDGEVRDGDDTGDGQRAPAGQAGGYTGFAQSMDTSVRGDLSDEIVMRVRAPEPDFWRGQTFTRFDGRLWHAEEDTGVLRQGPNIDIPPAFGDTASPDTAEIDRFVQTFYVEQDMPNVLFAAYRPVQAIVDADVWTRQDGALRASTVLPAGSIYTIVSARADVTAERLRSQGLIGDRLTRFGRRVLDPYLELPASTSPETIALAESLAEGKRSTYDVIRAYERWMGGNVVYDLDAPLPDDGEDAVHDFLFDSRRGFCEQIASALAIMLRSQGVPTRVATGYAAGERDRVAGVYEVRASDAHAWVEVWFPETGWQAFDPTASVPLSGDVRSGSVGADLFAGLSGYVAANPGPIVVVIVAGLAAWGLIVLVLRLGRRRRRGRWGVLQDRYTVLASARGAPGGATNSRRAEAWSDADDAAVARLVAEHLDRVAFDPAFEDDDDDFERTRKLVGTLATTRRRA